MRGEDEQKWRRKVVTLGIGTYSKRLGKVIKPEKASLRFDAENSENLRYFNQKAFARRCFGNKSQKGAFFNRRGNLWKQSKRVVYVLVVESVRASNKPNAFPWQIAEPQEVLIILGGLEISQDSKEVN